MNSNHKIVVVGAGHGGLIAAAKLAEKGFDVTVYEAQSQSDLGHDWEDRFTFPLLTSLTGINESDFPEGSWRVRGDCAFLSPAQKTKVIVRYDSAHAQKVMWRKSLIQMLVSHAESKGAKFSFNTKVLAPIVSSNTVVGISTEDGDILADMIIDAAGVFSPIRTQLPASFGIEVLPKYGDLFYAYRAYFDLISAHPTDTPFEVYLYHEGEQGLSWFCTNQSSADILIGRIYPLTEQKIAEQLSLFRTKHPWAGTNILHGGTRGIIPVRRPLTLMVANGYAAVGDSAFMTTPMNGMGIDLSLSAGALLADTILSVPDFSASSLWLYNRDFHRLYGGIAAKNEGLKNSILSMPSVGVDFLFDYAIIQASDLAGAGKNTKLSSLLGKFARGMRAPKYFFHILKGLIKGSKTARLYKSAPTSFIPSQISAWSSKISSQDIHLNVLKK